MEDDSEPAQICHVGTNLYMVTKDGGIYNWDMKISHRFKQEKYNDKGGYCEINAGKGFLIQRKGYLTPRSCGVSLEGVNNPTTNDIIKLRINVKFFLND